MPDNDIVLYKDIPQSVVDDITHVIEKDEGGWVLSSISGDNDGGWTFAGVTSVNLVPWMRDNYGCAEHSIRDNISYIVSRRGLPFPGLKEQIITFYYNRFLIPVLDIISASEEKGPPANEEDCETYELSCAVVCGIDGYRDVLKEALRRNTLHKLDDSDFLDAWEDHLIAICLHDPSKLKFLLGWINRVRKYRAGP